MPREEPVMTATFPDISNKVMFYSLFVDPVADAPVLL
jgi:hypothetical protein